MCTYQNCKNPDQLYDTRQDWIDHENTHRNVLRCPEHQSEQFNTSSELQVHLWQEHDKSERATSRNLVNHISDPVSMLPDRDCPICSSSLSTLRALRNHIALHLENLSVFSLPRNVTEDQDVHEEVGSNQANITADDSRAEDFDADMETASGTSTWSSDDKDEGAESPHRDKSRLTGTVLETKHDQPSSVENWLTRTSDIKATDAEESHTTSFTIKDLPEAVDSSKGALEWKIIVNMVIRLDDGTRKAAIGHLDMGWSVDVISEDLVDRLCKGMEAYNGPNIRSPKGSSICPIGTVTLQWHVKDYQLTHETTFMVLEEKFCHDFDVILSKYTMSEVGFYYVNNRVRYFSNED